MVMDKLLDLVDTAETGERVRDSLIGQLQEKKPTLLIEEWLAPLHQRIAALEEKE
jgi:hypothetical protein